MSIETVGNYLRIIELAVFKKLMQLQYHDSFKDFTSLFFSFSWHYEEGIIGSF